MAVKIETRYGTMEFKSWPKAHEFKEIIRTWTGFTEESRPVTVEQAVEYHLAYCEGGFAEVRAVQREVERKLAEIQREEYAAYLAKLEAIREEGWKKFF
jgi:hypothetical protein